MVTHPTILLPLLVSLSLLLTVDRGLGQDGLSHTATPAAQASVRNGGPLPPGCELARTVQSLTAFLDAFNQGATEELARVFPTDIAYPHTDKRGFQWYSVTDENGHFVTYDPVDLPAYFANRHQQHERLQLLKLEVAASWHPGVDLVFRLGRQADDLPRHEMTGKGAMYCEDQTIFVWSMAQDMAMSREVTAEP